MGGAISNTAITDDTLNNLFPNVSGPQSTAGADHYRCIYIRNSHGTLTLTNAKVWISILTTSTDDEVDIGLDSAAIGTDSTTTVTETDTGTSTPAGVSFTRPITSGTAIVIGDIPAGSKKALWIKRAVNAGASAFTNNSFQIQVSGETLA